MTSKKETEERLNNLVDLIKRGNISDIGNVLDDDKGKRLPKMTDERGWSALHFACQYKQYEIGLLLISHGFKADQEERFSRTPLDFVNDPAVKKELKEAYDTFVLKEKANELAMEEEQKIAAIQAKIRAKMEEEQRALGAKRDAAARRAAAEMAKNAEETMKITSMEKLLYTLEEKEKALTRLKIDSERDLFDMQKKLHAALAEVKSLKEAAAEQEKVESDLRVEVESLRGELARCGGGRGGPAAASASPRPASDEVPSASNKKSSGSAGLPAIGGVKQQQQQQGQKYIHATPDAVSKNSDEAAVAKISSQSAKKPFSLGGMFGMR